MNVVFGRQTIGKGPLEHWGVKVGESWYELPGPATPLNPSPPNEVVPHCDNSKYDIERRRLGVIPQTRDEVVRWMNRWLRKFPNYSWNEGNCQLFVRDFVRKFLGIELETQNRAAENWFATWVEGGLVAAGVAIGITAVGLLGMFVVNPGGFH